MNLLIRKLLINKYFYLIIIIFDLFFLLFSILNYKDPQINNNISLKCKITEFKFDGNTLSIICKNNQNYKINYFFKTEKELIIYKKQIIYGRIVEIYGEESIPLKNTIPNTFNYKNYLLSKKIKTIILANKIDILNNKIDLLNKIKNITVTRINKFNRADYMMTFIIGDKSLLETETVNNYRINGTSHLFAISGMHINLLSMIILFFLKKIKFNEKNRFIIISVFLIIYSIITNFSPSIIRSSLFFCLLALNKLLYTELSNLKVFIITITIIIVNNPFIIYNIGFIYSFITSLGLILNSKFLNKSNYFINLIKVSLVALLYSLPITLQNFYEINLLSLINNLIMVPIVSLIIYPFSLIVFVFPVLEYIFNFLIFLMEEISNICAYFQLNLIIPKNHLWILLIYYISLYFVFNYNYKSIYLCILLILLPKFINNSNYEIYYLDVGQGDSILIRAPLNKENIMIDVGGKTTYKIDKWQERKSNHHLSDNTILFLKSLGINYLDIVIITHGDYDHIGEAINLTNNFKIKNVIFNCGSYNNLEKELIKILDKKKINYYSCINELNIDKYRLQFLNTKEYDDENNNSNVIYTELNNYKFLFMGDAGVEKEKDILKKYKLFNIDVLKVGHHGSKTSSSKEFINKLNPKYSVISVEKNNRYGHPNNEVLDNLSDSNIYRTDQNGTIVFIINKNKLKIKTLTP